MEEYIKGNIRKILFAGDTGYVVGLIKVREVSSSDYGDFLNKTVTFTGNIGEVNNELEYKLNGKFVDHPRFGLQFQSTSFNIELPTERDGIILYLSTFKGIGTKTASTIVDRLGDDTIEKIKENYANLLLVPGMSDKKAKELHNKLVSLNSTQDTIIMLNKFGFNTKESLRIIKKYETNSEYIINNNIYDLKDIIDFKKLDAIYLSNNEESNIERIKALIPFIIETLCLKSGDSVLEIERVYLEFSKYFNESLKLETFIYYLEELNKEKIITLLDNFVTLKDYYDSERYISNYIKDANKTKINKTIKLDTLINKYEKDNKITFNNDQKNAIKGCLKNDFFIVTGGPGTGKTTIIKAVVDLHIKITKKESGITLLAPTGRASKRISESTGFGASTIHKFLEWNKETERFGVNEYNKSASELVIVDEASMIDIFLFNSLLRGLKRNIKLILVGDSNQLPSIGPGNVLKDLLSIEFINKLYLKEIYRTKKDSYLIDFANNIKEKENFKNFKKYSDFTFVESQDVHTKTYLSNICESLKNKKQDLDNFQVLAPMYKGENGIDNLNILMQGIFNPESKNRNEVKIGNKIYREKDKVLQLINDLDNNVFNGDIGYIKSIRGERSDLEVIIDYLGNEVTYKNDKLDNFTHAYAISIHKSQGSEYDNVVVILSSSFKRMFYNKLIYTAVTRAKKGLVLIGTLDNLNTSVSKNYSESRNTLLKSLLNE